jgi:hypothetical protein
MKCLYISYSFHIIDARQTKKVYPLNFISEKRLMFPGIIIFCSPNTDPSIYTHVVQYPFARRKIRHVEGNAKCCHLKKLTKGTLRQVFICLRPRTPYPPPYTLYICIQYTNWHREGGGSWTREKRRGATVHKAGSKILTWRTASPVYKLS